MASSLIKGFIRAMTVISVMLSYLSVDPCNNYTVLDEPRRSINNTNFLQSPPSYKCDTSVTWSGWYRLFINGLSAHMPETCVDIGHCDTATTLWIRGGHPTVEDGVVTRDVCGHWNNYCCFFWSFPIQVKACPGNYYVYELISPAVYCSGYLTIFT
ncbi:pancreatic secretory granule membrane major glycoprotein GP2-like [Cyprinus carpio]|uniref:Pancreatic secretory granule membrane major glycoprotein GP2-like n=1 Tax=Cyprinus carpio TaxID=7962 RepID=A0A9Q9YK29_CYPCA|nr:pancreatic secretory granule membrane major glycoprotein GP2-like [Cyprinus carpio]